MEDRHSAIFAKFGLDSTTARKNKNGFTVQHCGTSYSIRKTDAAHGKLKTSHYIKESLHENGFPIIDRFFCALDGNPFVTTDGKTFVAEENKLTANLFDLSPCDFSVEQERLAAAKILAELHKILGQIKPPAEYKRYLNHNKLPDSYYVTRRKELTRAKKWILNQSHMSDFDILFLRSYDMYIALTGSAIALTQSPHYRFVLANAIHNELISHCKFKEETIRMHNNTPHIIGFENCAYQPQFFDLGDLLRRSIKKTPPDNALPIIDSILNAYTKIVPLSAVEQQILLDRMLFPDKYLLIINRYYNKRKTWIPQQLVMQMQNALAEQERISKIIASIR